jgi:2',3'-cyclic-nucleotide 2'-phosphodiesterase
LSINILCIGDVVGSPGRGIVADHLPSLVEQHEIECVVCNAENIAGGSGLTPRLFNKLLHYGVDVVTLGDHCFKRSDVMPLLGNEHLIRPANLVAPAPGSGATVIACKSGRCRVGVVCAAGQMFMGNFNSPWQAVDEALESFDDDVRVRIVDFHAEATSEKIAMGWHLNGRVSAVFGTHTHVPTADTCVLDGGTAFISDLGMTGPYDSVLGRRKDRVLTSMVTGVPTRFEVADQDIRLSALLVSVDEETGHSVSAERIEIRGRTGAGAD